MKLFRWIAAILGMVTASSSVAAPPKSGQPQHAVIVHFNYGSKDLQKLFTLEDKLEAAIENAAVGEYDGHEIAVDGSDGYLYMYGPDADRLFQVVKPILESTPFMRGAAAKLRYGPPQTNVKEISVTISP